MYPMLVERNANNQITITVSSSVDSFGLQRVIDYVKYLEATSKSKAKQSNVLRITFAAADTFKSMASNTISLDEFRIHFGYQNGF